MNLLFSRTLFMMAAPVLLVQAFCLATSISETGTFAADNQDQTFNLTVTAPSTVQLQTWSYGGGTDIAGMLVAPGGFAPELSLFDAAGTLIALDAVGGTAPGQCYGRNVDPSTGFCFDAVLNDTSQPPLTLAAGTYTLVLTEQGNNPVGMLQDGFTEDAAHGNDPSFTGTNAGLPGAMFLDPGNFSQRTNSWEVDMITSSSATLTATPEPAGLMLTGAGLLMLALRRLRKHRSRNREA